MMKEQKIIDRETYRAIKKMSRDELQAFRSSKHDSDGHGYGLTNVKRAIEPYDGLLKINHNGEIFSIQALLYVG